MPLTTSTGTKANATPDPPELEPNPSHSPQTDYLAMNQNELSQHNIAETTATTTTRVHHHDKTLFAELFEFAKHRNWKKKLLTVVIVTSSVGVFIDLIFFGNIQSVLVTFLKWMADHTTLAVFAIILMFVVSTRKYHGWLAIIASLSLFI